MTIPQCDRLGDECLEGRCMTTGEDRLDRVERILEGIAVRQDAMSQQQQLLTQQLQETRAIADRTLQVAESNARSIQAWEARIEENRVEAEEERSELRVGLNDLRESVAELVRLSQRNEVEHELFRRRFEAIDPLTNGE